MELLDLGALLRGNRYPGRGIVIGRGLDGKRSAIAYFIMGRSGNSRNRVFVKTKDGIRTQAFDPSKMEDPSLIIYPPVRRMDEYITIVTNGDQTDTIYDFVDAGGEFEEALKTRTFEPDGPNWTPRISGMVCHTKQGHFTTQLSILKSADGNGDYCQRYFFDYPSFPPGEGRFLHTYEHDGDPLPSFEGEPRRVAITAPTAQQWAAEIWEALDPENKVSLYVVYTDPATCEREEIIINKNQQEGER